MEVFDGEGHLIGKVKDIGFTVGTDSISIIVSKGPKEEKSIPWNNIQAVGEIVILKKAEQAPACPSCKGPLRFIDQYKRWYCDKEKKYA